MNRLCDAALVALPKDVARPAYDRSRVRTGIVHLGVGGFHRAHQAVFADDALNAGAQDWGIAAASLRSPATRDALAPQDGLYTLALRDQERQQLRVIGSVRQVLVAPEDPAALLAVLTDPGVRIVSLTVTEKGYSADVVSGELNLADPDIRHDLAHPDRPRSTIGFLAEALARRRSARAAPFTLLSCDNLAGNGHLLHRVLTEFARLRDPGFGRFVADAVACPSTMVDRIVPATTDADRAMIARILGLDDAWPVMAEPYVQWVIEDRFPSGRPDWEASGVEFASDVAPHEAMKLRLLNGAHSTIAAMGRVAGLATVAETMANPVFRAFIAAYWQQVAPTIAPEIDVAAYTTRLTARFDNTALNHRCAQIATDASLKLPQRIIAPLRELIAQQRPAGLVIFALAVWIRSCLGADEAGRALLLSDPPLQAWTGRPTQETPSHMAAAAFAGFAPVFGEAGPDLAPALGEALSAIRTLGLAAATAARLAQH